MTGRSTSPRISRWGFGIALVLAMSGGNYITQLIGVLAPFLVSDVVGVPRGGAACDRFGHRQRHRPIGR